jgi:hypothetical protein
MAKPLQLRPALLAFVTFVIFCSNSGQTGSLKKAFTEGDENEGEAGRIRKAEREETKETSLWLVRCLGTGKRNGRNVHGRSMGVKRQLRAAGVGDIDVGPVTEANLSDQLLETSGNPF